MDIILLLCILIVRVRPNVSEFHSRGFLFHLKRLWSERDRVSLVLPLGRVRQLPAGADVGNQQ